METFHRPTAGIDYPRNLQEFDRRFADEAACRTYIFRVRWPVGYECFRCRSKAPPWITSRGYLHCRQCSSEISITAGTVFERTRKPLRTWFQAIWLVTSQKHGTNALGLQRVLGLGSYQTAWTWLHKLRRAMWSGQTANGSMARLRSMKRTWVVQQTGARHRKQEDCCDCSGGVPSKRIRTYSNVSDSRCLRR